jgi:hypothetical protein
MSPKAESSCAFPTSSSLGVLACKIARFSRKAAHACAQQCDSVTVRDRERERQKEMHGSHFLHCTGPAGTRRRHLHT